MRSIYILKIIKIIVGLLLFFVYGAFSTIYCSDDLPITYQALDSVINKKESLRTHEESEIVHKVIGDLETKTVFDHPSWGDTNKLVKATLLQIKKDNKIYQSPFDFNDFTMKVLEMANNYNSPLYKWGPVGMLANKIVGISGYFHKILSGKKNVLKKK